MDKRFFFFLLAGIVFLVGCHNNAHLRTQKILKPGEKVYSGSGVLAMGGVKESKEQISDTANVYYREPLINTGVMGIRVEVSMLTGGKDSESGPYLGFGAGEDGPGFIVGYDYRKYIGLNNGSPKKLGAQFEVDISEMGQVFHLRPSLTTATKKGWPFYGGVHSLLAVGRLMHHLEWETSGSGGLEYNEQEIDYSFNSLGAGLTAGAEFLTLDNNSIQLQVDVSLVKNSFNTDTEPPVIDMENVEWFSWDKGSYEYGGDFSHKDDPELMVTGSVGISFFKPGPNTGKPLGPLPLPVQVRKPTYDPETGEKIPSDSQFDPETGEKTTSGSQFDPKTGLREPAGGPKKELTYGEITNQAREAAKRMHNKSNHQLCGAGSCVLGPMGILSALLYANTGVLSTMNPYDPFYLDLNPRQQTAYKIAYINKEKQLRTKTISITQLFCGVLYFFMISLGD